MSEDNVNWNELPPQGNANFPPNPPPVVANPHYQHGAPPVQQLPPPQHYHGPQFVPMIAPSMQQQWPLGYQQPMQQVMNPEVVNRNALPPHGNPNFPTNPPPVVANPPYQYGVHLMPQLPQPHQMPYYNPPQFVPMIAQSMQQQWPLGHQQPVQQMVQQWPYVQPTNSQQAQWPQSPSGYVAPSNVPQSPYYYNVQQQTPVPTSSSPPQQWNVNAREFVPRPVLDGASSSTSSGTGFEEESSHPEESSAPEIKETTPPPAELEELVVEATLERLQDVISLGAPASETSVSSKEEAGNALGRSPSLVNSSTEEDVLIEHIDTRMTAFALDDVGVLEDVTAETSSKDEPSTSATPSELTQKDCTAESQKKALQNKKKQKKEAKKLAKKVEEDKKREDAAALDEAFSSNASHNIEKNAYRNQLVKYVETEKKRRREFKKNGFKLPSGTDVHWMSADIYLYQKVPDTRSKQFDQQFHDRVMASWMEICEKNPREAFLAPCIAAFRDFHDDLTNHDLVYLMEMMVAFPGYTRSLRGRLLGLLFNIENNLPLVAKGRDENSTIAKYLKRHTVLRYSNEEVADALTKEEAETIAAFKNHRWDGMCVLQAASFFQHLGEVYWNHSEREQKPFIKRNAAVFRYLSTIPSPILAFDASFCFPNKFDLKSNTRYAILVMGNDEVPPYEE